MEPYTRNGSIIGKTMDFGATDFYSDFTKYQASINNSFGIYQQNAPAITDTFTVNTTGISASDTLVLIYHIEAESPSSSYSPITVDGVGCTVDIFLNVQESGNAYNSVAIARISGITASSVTVSVYNGFTGTRYRSALSAYGVNGPITLLDTDTVSAATNVSSETYTLDIDDQGIVFFAQSLGDENDTSSWASATELYDQAHQENNAHLSAAYLLPSTTGTLNETVTYTGAANGIAGVAASYSTGTTTIKNKKNSGIWDLQAAYETAAVPQAPAGQVEFTTTGTTSWTVPDDVTSVSAVCVGGGGASGNSGFDFSGGGGGGGGLAWANNIAVTPGESLEIVVGAGGRDPSGDGGESNINRSGTFLVRASGGNGGASTGTGVVTGTGGTNLVGDGGGTGGTGGQTGSNTNGGGGGGAAGYSGNGGNGGFGNNGTQATAGSGGGGGGGNPNGSAGCYGGGGVGILGEGTSGAVNSGGSGGGDPSIANSAGQLTGGVYGGGGGAEEDDTFISGTRGAQGAVRIIWGDATITRAFPSTNTGDV